MWEISPFMRVIFLFVRNLPLGVGKLSDPERESNHGVEEIVLKYITDYRNDIAQETEMGRI